MYDVFVDFHMNPSTYKVLTADMRTGNITHYAETVGNMDFAYLFLLP